MNVNTFPTIMLRNLNSLQRIDLSDNAIETLPAGMFEDFQTWWELHVYLERNNISTISPQLLRGTDIHLSLLKLGDNHITNLDFIDICLPAFQYGWMFRRPQIRVNDNPLECDCDLLNLVNQENVTITATCAQPPPYHGMTLYDSLHQSYNETGELKCPVTDQIDCTSGCDNLMTSSLLTVAYVIIIYVTVEWMA